MIPRQERRPPDQLQPAGGCILEFEDLWSEHRQFRGWLESATLGLVAPASNVSEPRSKHTIDRPWRLM